MDVVASNTRLKSTKSLKSIQGEEKGSNIKYKRKEKQLTQEQIEVFRQAFDIFDSDHSGNIDK